MKNLRNLFVTIILGSLVYFLGYHWAAKVGMALMAVGFLIITDPIYIRGKKIVKEKKSAW